MTRPVPDEVWQRLDPRAGVLSRRAVIRNWIALAMALVLFIAGALVWRSGVIAPRLVWPDGMRAWSLHQSGLARVQFLVFNAGWAPVTVLEVGRSAPGLELVRVDGGDVDFPAASPLPITLAPGTGIGVVLVYRVSDCETPPRGDWPVTARVQRPWGVMTVDVLSDAPAGSPWQEDLVDLWCDPQAWPID
jgi:hypothetical protein